MNSDALQLVIDLSWIQLAVALAASATVPVVPVCALCWKIRGWIGGLVAQIAGHGQRIDDLRDSLERHGEALRKLDAWASQGLAEGGQRFRELERRVAMLEGQNLSANHHPNGGQGGR